MSLNLSQVTVTQSAGPLLTTPPGPCSITFSNNTGAAIYVGTSSAVSATNGFPIPSGAPPVTVVMPPGAKPVVLQAIAGGATTGGLGVIISTPN